MPSTGHPMGVATETLTGHRTMTTAEARSTTIWALDPGGSARNLVLPTASECTGIFLFISNTADAAEVLTIQDPAGPSTVCTPTQAEDAVVWCTGTLWHGGTVTSS